jgi:hypothetical protein
MPQQIHSGNNFFITSSVGHMAIDFGILTLGKTELVRGFCIQDLS